MPLLLKMINMHARGNNSFMLLESSCSEVENQKAKVSFSEIGQLFSLATLG